MHHIYHTEGIILGSKNFGEAGKYYFILTRDLGMVRATAAGVRKLSSKLRFVLRDYTYVKIDLVRGREFWRVTSASKTNELDNLAKDKKTFTVFVNITKLLRRLLQGEGPNEYLFADLLGGLVRLEKSREEEEIRNIEIILVLRILSNLGYIGGDKAMKALIESPFEEELLSEASRSRTKILNKINRALRETHL